MEEQTLWYQQLVKIGLISLNKVDTLENRADVLTKHVPRAVLINFVGMMGYTFLGAETAKFQTYTSIRQNYWDQKVAAVMKLPVFDDEENDEPENDIQSFVDKTTHLTTAVLRAGC